MLYDPHFVFAAWLCVGAIGVCWLSSVITGNYSQVDRLWSIIPPVYVAWFWSRTDFSDSRLMAMTMLTVLWGARLTFNFARKGGYKRGHEDYRWPILRSRMSKATYQVFNGAFIAGYQNVLLFLITLPAYLALQHTGTPWGGLDTLATGGFLLFLFGETWADQQQWNFHQHKAARQALGESIESPFLTTGLFRYSRHPNFFCEQAIWWCVYLFSVSASGQWLNGYMLGAVLLVLLFQGSTAFTESLSLKKYPTYAAYQRTTSRLFPWFSRA